MNESEQILRQAAEIIRGNFFRGSYEIFLDHVGRVAYCMDGAVRRSTKLIIGNWYGSEAGNYNYIAAIEALIEHIPVVEGCDVCLEYRGSRNHVHHYNDAHCTGGFEAAEILEKAAGNLS